jgi:hypothetical protein
MLDFTWDNADELASAEIDLAVTADLLETVIVFFARAG